MGDVVNLRLARKASRRAAAARVADANRIAHDRPRSERAAAEAERDRLGRALDGARRDDR